MHIMLERKMSFDIGIPPLHDEEAAASKLSAPHPEGGGANPPPDSRVPLVKVAFVLFLRFVGCPRKLHHPFTFGRSVAERPVKQSHRGHVLWPLRSGHNTANLSVENVST